MSSQVSWLVALGLLLFHGGPPRARSLVLDLTTPSVRDAERARTTGCGGGGGVYTSEEAYVPPVLPVRLRIVALNHNSYRVGEPVRATLRLTNTGGRTIPIPWTVNPDLVRTENCTWLPLPPGVKPLHASIALYLLDDAGNLDVIDAHSIFGITSDAATYRSLAPNGSMEVRLKGSLRLDNIEDKRQQEKKPLLLPRRFRVVAGFDYYDVPDYVEYPEVRSGNSIQVTVTAK